jgi:hypothetical protein
MGLDIFLLHLMLEYSKFICDLKIYLVFKSLNIAYFLTIEGNGLIYKAQRISKRQLFGLNTSQIFKFGF